MLGIIEGLIMNSFVLEQTIKARIDACHLIINEANRENYMTAGEVKRSIYDTMEILGRQLEGLRNE